MNIGETVPERPGQQTPTRVTQDTAKSDAAKATMGKALDALFKAQEHLNTAADQGGAEVSKAIDGINQSLRSLQREVSQVIYRIGKST
jgi:hypothetical protein